jgi:hypothetical protein
MFYGDWVIIRYNIDALSGVYWLVRIHPHLKENGVFCSHFDKRKRWAMPTRPFLNLA